MDLWYDPNAKFLVSSEPEDYAMGNQTLVFSAGLTRQCTNFTVEDDNILEGMELFQAFLFSGPDFIILDPSTANITIIDDDGKY